MRWGFTAVVIGLSVLLGVPPTSRAQTLPGFYEAQHEFEGHLEPRLRQIIQVWLIVGGYMNSVPTERFSTRIFKALQAFQTQNGLSANGRLDRTQVDRLSSIVDPMFNFWGLTKVSLPGHGASIWIPFGLGLDVRATDRGFRYRDRQGRVEIGFFALPNVSLAVAYDGLIAKERALGTTIHYGTIKDGWFAVSTTKTDGSDHYYRYHQDGAFITGFVMDWNNAAGNISAERIAVLNSAILAASMNDDPFVDPPSRPAPQARIEPNPAPAQPITVPIAPVPAPKTTFSSGTGFFVADDGSLVTNAHVVANCSDIAVKTDDGSVSSAVRVATDATNDLALLRLTKLPPKAPRIATIRVGTRLGEGVEAFGFPHSNILSTSGNFTLGNITAMTGLKDDIRFFQMSTPVQAGNSGGPLLDTSGNVVGVVSAKLDAIKVMLASDDLPQNVNFAVKAAMLTTFLDANRVSYTSGVAAVASLQPADIAEQARAMSGFVVCR